MKDSYKYLDPDFIYSDAKSHILKNKANIADSKLLLAFESLRVSKRLEELAIHPFEVHGISSLFEIHRYLFQDVYDWAGKMRTVEISKAGKQFFPIERFGTALPYLDKLIHAFLATPPSDRQKISNQLANILDAINEFHPFREGNGRAQREFIRELALKKDWLIDLNPPDNENIYRRYMEGTIEGDLSKLTALIFELLK
jgi:cell filamentation protein